MKGNEAFALAGFEDHLKYKLKDSTIEKYMICIKAFLKEGYDFDNPEDYAKFLEEHTIKKRNSSYYNVILKFVNFHFSEQKEKRKQIRDIIKIIGKRDKDPVRKSMIISKQAQFEIIKKLNTPKHQLIAWIQKECGVRAGDVIRLKRDSIKFGIYKNEEGVEEKILDIHFLKKGDKVQKIPIFDETLMEYIKIRLREIGDEEYVFIDRDVVNEYNRDNPLRLEDRNYKLYWLDLRQACESLGYEAQNFSTHDWRRNFAEDVWTNVLDKRDIVALQNTLGHAKVETTIRYLRQSGLESKDIFRKKHNL